MCVIQSFGNTDCSKKISLISKHYNYIGLALIKYFLQCVSSCEMKRINHTENKFIDRSKQDQTLGYNDTDFK